MLRGKRVVRVLSGHACRLLDQGGRFLRCRNPGASEHHHGGADAAIALQDLGLQELQLQALRPQLVTQHEVVVGEA